MEQLKSKALNTSAIYGPKLIALLTTPGIMFHVRKYSNQLV